MWGKMWGKSPKCGGIGKKWPLNVGLKKSECGGLWVCGGNSDLWL